LDVKTWKTGYGKGLIQKMIPVLDIKKYQSFVSYRMNAKIQGFGFIFANINLRGEQKTDLKQLL
jgi:hypothetical protein